MPLVIDSALKGAVLLAAAAIVALAMYRASAAARHLVWLVAVVALLVVPVLSCGLAMARKSPNLDAFAKSAHRFVNSHVTVPICQPGRSALMTGRVPHRNGALGFNPIRRDVPTLVEVLRDKGYYTAAIAKAVHMAPADKFPWHAIGEQALGKQPTKFAEKFRELLASAAREKKPFFINANICDPHRPFIGGSGKKAKAGEPFDGAMVFQPNDVKVPAFLEDIPSVREEVAQYYSSVSRFDVAFGLVMQELTAAGRDADTVVLFMSDHGMSFPFSKATVYHNGTWSPVLIRIPGMAEAHTRTEFVSSVDVMPSLLELLAVKPPAGMDGRSWLPLLKGETQADRDFVITHVNTVSSGKSLAQRCIRTKDRALMFHAWVGGPNTFRVEAMSGPELRRDERIDRRDNSVAREATRRRRNADALRHRGRPDRAKESHQRPAARERRVGAERKVTRPHEANRRPADEGL
jgi:N-sulfoglucosamine sulfohydrolase